MREIELIKNKFNDILCKAQDKKKIILKLDKDAFSSDELNNKLLDMFILNDYTVDINHNLVILTKLV